MSVGQALALFAPLSGLVALAFWSGVLSNRVSALERALANGGTNAERLVRLETLVAGQSDSIEKIESSLEGIHRSLRDLVTLRPSTLIELPPSR